MTDRRSIDELDDRGGFASRDNFRSVRRNADFISLKRVACFPTSEMGMVLEAPNWLDAAFRGNSAPAPPKLDSDRIKLLIQRALLKPGDLSALEVQELAAAVLSHLVDLKGD